MRHLFLISHYPLFSYGLESLLRKEPDVSVVGREADPEKALRRIQTLQSDVVIFDGSDPEYDAAAISVRILRNGLPAQIIGLNLVDNTIYIFHGEQHVVTQVSDLVDAIKGPLANVPP